MNIADNVAQVDENTVSYQGISLTFTIIWSFKYKKEYHHLSIIIHPIIIIIIIVIIINCIL